MSLLETLYLTRVTDAGRLAPALQSRLKCDRRLQAALSDNALLAPPLCPAAPELRICLAQAFSRAQAVPRATRRSTARPLRLGWTLAGALLLAGLALALLVLPHRTSWAQMDGYILRYPLVYPGYASSTFDRLIPGPPRELEHRVEAWAAQHADAAPEGWKAGVAYCSGFNWSHEDPWVKQHAQLPLVQAAVMEVTLVSGDKALLESLLDATRDIAHVNNPEVVNESWLYSRRQTQMYSKQDSLIINGKKFVFPQDFYPDDAAQFGQICSSLNVGYPMAYAFFDAELERRCGLGTICKMERVDQNTISVETLTKDAVFKDLAIPEGYAQGMSVQHYKSTERIINRMYDIAKASALNKLEEFKELRGWGIVIPLLPPERFEGALNGTQPTTLNPEELAQTEASYAKLRAVFDAWATDNAPALAATHYRGVATASPEAIYTSPKSGVKSQNLKDYDRVCLAFSVVMYVEDPALRDSLLSALNASGLVHPALLWELYPIKVPLTQLQGRGSWHAAE